MSYPSTPLPDDDFRREREILPAEIFLGGEGRDRPPSDLMSQEGWDHVMSLPDDVAIMTSSHQGSLIDEMNALSNEFLSAVYREDLTGPFMQVPTIFACDEVAALVFITLSGYYRQALGCLRNALEVTVHGAAFAIREDVHGLARWLDATDDPTFGGSCRTLHESRIGTQLRSGSYCVFGEARHDSAWARQMYHRLCGYAHSRAGATNVDLWQSNGPIRVPSVVLSVREQMREVLAFLYLLLRIGKADFQLPPSAASLYEAPSPDWSDAAALVKSSGLLDFTT